MKKTFLTALILYFLTLTFRLPGISTNAPQADELHWQARSYQVVRLFREKEYSNLTTHLGQPGIPAVSVIATSEALADRYNRYKGERVVNYLTAGRVGIALVTSLIVPFVFLSLSLMGFFWPGLLASAFLALELSLIHI